MAAPDDVQAAAAVTTDRDARVLLSAALLRGFGGPDLSRLSLIPAAVPVVLGYFLYRAFSTTPWVPPRI